MPFGSQRGTWGSRCVGALESTARAAGEESSVSMGCRWEKLGPRERPVVHGSPPLRVARAPPDALWGHEGPDPLSRREMGMGQCCDGPMAAPPARAVPGAGAEGAVWLSVAMASPRPP